MVVQIDYGLVDAGTACAKTCQVELNNVTINNNEDIKIDACTIDAKNTTINNGGKLYLKASGNITIRY